jgi:hypothetical protein
MQQKKVGKNGAPRSGWGNSGQHKCHFCRKRFHNGEEMIFNTGDGYNCMYMHRSCLDDWLKKHPPFKAGESTATRKQAEIDAEFEALRVALEAEVLKAKRRRPKKATAKIVR